MKDNLAKHNWQGREDCCLSQERVLFCSCSLGCCAGSYMPATPTGWLKLVAKFRYLAILKKEGIHNRLAILQS